MGGAGGGEEQEERGTIPSLRGERRLQGCWWLEGQVSSFCMASNEWTLTVAQGGSAQGRGCVWARAGRGVPKIIEGRLCINIVL
eukprot:739689-Hanusia_phi.AAC.2